MLRSAILIYLACGEHGNEGITHRPKDESEFLAKKKTIEANIFNFFSKGEPISKFWALQIKLLTVSLCSTICDVYASWRVSTCRTPNTPWKFHPFNPPPPRNFHLPSAGGYGYFLEPHYIPHKLTSGLKSNFTCDNVPTKAILFSLVARR